MYDGIKVNFDGLSNTGGDIKNQGAKIQAELDQLKSRLAPLEANWHGASSDNYREAQRLWNTSSAELRELLTTIGIAVGQAADAYRQAEQVNSNRWV